jgi:hypothetical protein
MFNFAQILPILQNLLTIVPEGGPFRGFLEALVQILTFATGFQLPS